MSGEVLFISDLHLSASFPRRTAAFLNFMSTHATGADQLFILGDLFDAYIGDDDNSSPNVEVKQSLFSLSRAGTEIYFLHGNRDFLVGENFSLETGLRFLDDYAVIDLYGTPALVTHGDLLCTADAGYQQVRSQVRTDEWKKRALSKPLLVRQIYARWYRLKSRWDKKGKTMKIMDVNHEAVLEALDEHQVHLIIHGHTHRPGYEEISEKGSMYRRFVLPEWENNATFLRWSRSGNWSYQHIA
jgi:UDP-2,3-diacylglucosamine hydrolase